MATIQTTTLRVPVQLRDEIARLAEYRHSTMVDVVSEAIHRLTRDEWWDGVHRELDGMTLEETAAYRAESKQLDGAADDGLRAD